MLAAPPLEWVGPTMRSAESAKKIMEWLVGHSGMMEVFYSGLAPIRGTWLLSARCRRGLGAWCRSGYEGERWPLGGPLDRVDCSRAPIA